MTSARTDAFFELGGDSLSACVAAAPAVASRGASATCVPRNCSPTHACRRGVAAGRPRACRVTADGFDDAARHARTHRHRRHGGTLPGLLLASKRSGATCATGANRSARSSRTNCTYSIPLSCADHPAYVRARGTLDGVEVFRCGVLRHLSPRGAADRSATSALPRMHLACAGTCRLRARIVRRGGSACTAACTTPVTSNTMCARTRSSSRDSAPCR